MELGADMPMVGLSILAFFTEWALHRIKLIDVGGKQPLIDLARTAGEGPPDMLHGRCSRC